jgi:uncharacterized membrane protein YdbT with pleckstrin-like domain
MIQLDQEQQLGEKAYLLMASRKMMPGVIIFLIAAILISLKGAIAGFIYGAFVAGGQGGAITAAAVSGAVVNVILAVFIVSLAVLLLGIVIARLEYRNYTYTFEEFDLRMRHGILSRAITSIPYRQIQDVDIDRSLSMQLMGLSKLTIITAGHEEAAEHEKVEVVLEPLQKEVAEDIRQMIERKIGVQVVRTVQEADSEDSGSSSEAPSRASVPAPTDPASVSPIPKQEAAS